MSNPDESVEQQADASITPQGEWTPHAAAEQDVSRSQRMRQIAMVVGGVLIIFALLFGWRALRNSGPPPAPPPPSAVVATVVSPSSVPASIEAIGSLRAVREVMLSPEVAGRVSAIHFSPGQAVGAGASLVQLYDGPERADRAAAVARANLASVQVRRSRELVPVGAESREVLQQRQAEQAEAHAAIRQLDARLRQKRVVAPFSGIVGVRKVNLGQYLNPGDEVASLTDLSQLYVNFTVAQQNLSKLAIGREVTVTSDAWPGRRFVARVTTIEPRIDEESRNVWVQGLLANPDTALRPGMYVNASLSIPGKPDALVVPATAIMTSAQGNSVAAIRGKTPRREGKVEIVIVETGVRFDNSVVVTKGLKPGDVIIAEGQLRVQPNAPVKVSKLVPAVAR